MTNITQILQLLISCAIVLALGVGVQACEEMTKAETRDAPSATELAPAAPHVGEQAHRGTTPQPSATPSAAEASAEAQQAARREDPGLADSGSVTRAMATLHGTEGNETRGQVRFEQDGDDIAVKATFEGLPEGTHAYHIHLFGDCSGEDGKTAGTHFNLAGSSTEPPADIGRITGNLGEVEADSNGHAEAIHRLKGAKLSGRFGVIGRAVIIHQKGNDKSQPPIGAAGPRLACGVIGIAESTGAEHASL